MATTIQTINMITTTENTNQQVCWERLIPFGFRQHQEHYIYTCRIMNGAFEAHFIMNTQGKLQTKIYDTATQEEYILFHITQAQGSFIQQMRAECHQLQQHIIEQCFQKTLFIQPQAQRLLTYIEQQYQDKPDFPFKKYPQFAVFRYPTNQKWYALLMKLPRNKIDHHHAISANLIDIVNIRFNKNKIEQALSYTGVYPAYHMNKKSWVSIILDDTVCGTQLWQWLAQSRQR